MSDTDDDFQLLYGTGLAALLAGVSSEVVKPPRIVATPLVAANDPLFVPRTVADSYRIRQETPNRTKPRTWSVTWCPWNRAPQVIATGVTSMQRANDISDRHFWEGITP